MTGMEGFRYIRTRELDDYSLFALARILGVFQSDDVVVAVALALLADGRDDGFAQGLLLEPECHEIAQARDFFQQGILWKLSAGQNESATARQVNACARVPSPTPYLLDPLLGQFVGLLSLDPQRWFCFVVFFFVFVCFFFSF